jgi:hypothetical protein
MADFFFDHDDDIAPDVTDSVSEWIAETDDLLGRLQIAIELLHLESGLAPESKRMTSEMLSVIRQLRAETPRPEAVATWLRALASDTGVSRLRGPARFINTAHSPPPKSPTGA